MNTIVQLSAYGFRLDSLKNDWTGCDKIFLKSELFKSLKKGDRIEIRERNKAGFVTDIRIVPEYNIDNIKVPSFVLPKDRDILKGQCLNIAFNCLFNNPEVNFEFDGNRKKAVALAHDLYNDLKEDYFKW